VVINTVRSSNSWKIIIIITTSNINKTVIPISFPQSQRRFFIYPTCPAKILPPFSFPKLEMKEHIALHRNRPFAICSASDLNLEHHGTILDEDIALKMRFPIRQLQYVRLSLKTDSSNECTRTVGVTRCTIQTISHGRPDRSVSFVARVVRDLHQLTGAEALADANLMKRLRTDMKVEKELEKEREIGIPSDMDVMGHSDTGSATAQDEAGQFYSDSDIDHWARCDTSWPVKPVSLNRQDRDISSCGSDDDASSYGTDDSRTDRDVSSRGSDSATSYGTDDSRGAADRAWREMTG
jgi:hypothetical protein